MKPAFCFAILFLILPIGLYSAEVPGVPQVLKVEPPNWWPDHTLNPIRLLIHGRNLADARIETASKELTIQNPRISSSGTYLFVDLFIARDAKPGEYSLMLRNAAGSATFAFHLLRPLPRDGRFQGFSPEDVMYLLMPDRFANGDPTNDDPAVSRGLLDRKKSRYYHGGDLQGVIDHLPYLKDLGITALWLNPIYDNVNHLNEKETYDGQAITDYHGYGAVDFYAVDEHLGDVAMFRKMVDQAHQLGIKVIQDQVANHTGPYHPWAHDPPTPAWYHGTVENHPANTWQTWTLVDPYATPDTQKATLEGWFINILPDLNQEDPETTRYLIQNTLWWIGMSGIDGIRQDTLPYVSRRFWHDWSSAIKREYPQFTVVGEMWDGDAAKVSFFQGGCARFDGIDSGIDTVFDFPLFYPLRQAFAEGKSVRDLAVALSHDPLYPHPEWLVTFLGLHDVPRFMNDSHADRVGLKLAYTFLMTARGIPLIYYGDEIAMPGGGDPDNRRDFPGGWAEDEHNAFIDSGRTPEEREVFDHVRRLAHLRQELAALRRGRMVNLWVEPQTYVYARIHEGPTVIMALNNGNEPATFECPVESEKLPNGTVLQDRLGIHPDVSVERGQIHLTLTPRSGAIFTAR